MYLAIVGELKTMKILIILVLIGIAAAWYMKSRKGQ